MIRAILILLLSFSIGYCKLPDLSPRDVRIKLNEILKAHVTYDQMTPELAQRVLKNFLDELDPSKTYLTDADIHKWINPSDALLKRVLEGFRASDFTVFKEIHEVMLQAIKRRNDIEIKSKTITLPEHVDPEEFKDLEWVDTEANLLTRILRIKSLQFDTAKKFNDMDQEQFLQRVNKRRLNRELEISGETTHERNKVIFTYVLKATATALDSHTNYFTPSEATQFMIQVQQRLFGIGAQLRDNLNGFTIVRILEGGPAHQGNKLKINDRIVAVDKEPVVGMDIIEAVELIRGEKGTKVLLTVLREVGEEDEKKTEKVDIEITRGEVVLEESRLEKSFEPFGDGVIAHLRLYSFYQDPKSSSASDIKQALEKMSEEHKIKGVILDLRSNSGGLLPQAVSVTGLFITKGIVVSIKDNSGKIQHLRDDSPKVWDGPLLVLTDKGSASAAEIVAQTLQDYGRAVVVGDSTTFGKGTFQTFTLDTAHNGKVNPKGEYKVTRGKYYTVSGKSPQLVGVRADIVVPGILSELDIGEGFVKYPVQNDQIAANFEDDLSDIPPLHRQQVGRLYMHNLQTKLSVYTEHFESLRINSQKRLENNKNYQNFLKEIQKKHFDAESVEAFGQNDLQYIEACNIMKDLIFLLQIQESDAA